MNVFRITALTAATAVLSFAALAVQAAEADGSQWLDVALTKSRGQVAAELAQARRDGTTGASGTTYKWLNKVQYTAQRDEVKAEFKRARAAGQLPAVGEGADGSIAQRSAPKAQVPRTVAVL